MPARRRLILLAAAAWLAASPPAAAAPRLHPLSGSSAVVQRDRPVVVRGEADPGEYLTVRFAGAERPVRADRAGLWSVSFPAMKAGGPHRIRVTGAAGATATADDILVGDVWLCSGQSNMEFSVSQSTSGPAEARAAADPRLRLITIPQRSALTPQREVPGDVRWQRADPASVGDFSGACYFMVRDLRARQRVAVGAIDASLGGTAIRAWMSERSARAAGAEAEAQLLALYRSDPSDAAERFGELWGRWWRSRTGDAPGSEPWRASRRLAWKPMPSIAFWEQWGDPAFAAFNGVMWARHRFTLSAAQAAQPATLSLGVIDEIDHAFVNGVGVGSSHDWSTPREYPVRENLLRAGDNEILVYLRDNWAAGGFQGPAERLKLVFADRSEKALGREWAYALVAETVGEPPLPPWDTKSGIATLYNGMIAPLGAIGLKGVAWYQGESDTQSPGYDRRLAGMMHSWRDQFAKPDLPFLIVGIAGWGKAVATPIESGSARLRDEQRRAAAADAAAAFVPVVDLGDQADLHPPNKQDVGRRLALAARAVAYRRGGDIAPQPLRARRTAGGVRIEFSEPVTAEGGPPGGFELCGPTTGSCRQAGARTDGAAVVIETDARPATRVRYAWSDFPTIGLRDAARLPVPTFEMPID